MCPRVSSLLALTFVLASGCGGSGGAPPAGAKDMAAPGDDLGVSDDLGASDQAQLPGPDMANNCASLSDTPVRITQDITSDTKFTCDKLYQVAGLVYVRNNATLTIDPGTTITLTAGSSLAVQPNSKLMAVGTRDLPIVFTSAQLPGARKAGDWGTVVLVGNAPGNWGTNSGSLVTTGARADANGWPTPPSDGVDAFPIPTGTSGDINDSSGQLKYVRFEYGGLVVNENGQRKHEMLALYGVGRGTTLEYIDMRQAYFECLFSEGGAFYARHLVCQWSGNGGFGFSRGNVSKAQFLFDQESPTKEAEGVGIKGPYGATTLPPRTDPLIYNVTVCGTNGAAQQLKDPWGLFLVRNPAGKIYNMIATGFNAGVASQQGNNNNLTELHSSIFFHNHDARLDMAISTNIFESSVTQDTPNLDLWFYTSGWYNSEIDPKLDDCFNPDVMGGKPATPIMTNAATPPDDGFFDPSAGYIGAFKDRNDNWATGNWVVWSSN